MKALARRTDPITSHIAARKVTPRIAIGKLIVRELITTYPHRTYKELFKHHRESGGTYFADPPSLMRRLSEVGSKAGRRVCEESGTLASTWVQEKD